MKNSFSLFPRTSSRIFHLRSYWEYVRCGKNRRHSLFALTMSSRQPNYTSRNLFLIAPSNNNVDPVATKCKTPMSSFRLYSTTSQNTAIGTTNSSSAIQERSTSSGGILPEVQTQVLDTCTDIHSSIMALNEKLRGPLPKNSVSPYYFSSYLAAKYIFLGLEYKILTTGIVTFPIYSFYSRTKVLHYPSFCLWGIIPVVNLPSLTIYFKGTCRLLEWHRRMIVSP